jgi:DNA-binding beta-propeller fold protein YncE
MFRKYLSLISLALLSISIVVMASGCSSTATPQLSAAQLNQATSSATAAVDPTATAYPPSATTTVTPAPNEGRDLAAPLAFQGRYIVSVSDADMLASAYVDGQLGPREGNDALSVIPLNGDYRDWQAYEIEVSNSVAGPPTSVTLSPDGRWAFVVETFQQAAEDAQTFNDLQSGSLLLAVDLSDPQNPRIVTRLDIGTRPESVEINAGGDMLLITLHPEDGRQLAFVPWRDGQFGTPAYTTLPEVPADTRVSHAIWHPSGDYIAGALVDQDRVLFARVQRDGDSITLQPWGNATVVGKFPFKIQFTPNGRYVLTTNLQWGPDVEGFWSEAPRGQIGVVRFSTEPEQSGQPRHPLVSVAETGVSPEGIAISPNGQFVVTTNLERSYLPYDDNRITWFSSLTLLRLNSETGTLETLGDYAYDGILPEAAVFDSSSQYLAVATYDHFNDRRQGGSIDFWRLVTDDPTHPTPRLAPTNHTIQVTRGAHSMALAP